MTQAKPAAKAPPPELERITVKCVSIESPYSSASEAAIVRNAQYAREAMLDSCRRGESPYASHLLLTQVLNDTIQSERTLGLALSHAWRLRADLIAFYIDHGMSPGMRDAEALAKANGIETDYRRLYNC